MRGWGDGRWDLVATNLIYKIIHHCQNMHIVLEIEADNALIKEYLPVLEAAENLGKLASSIPWLNSYFCTKICSQHSQPHE